MSNDNDDDLPVVPTALSPTTTAAAAAGVMFTPGLVQSTTPTNSSPLVTGSSTQSRLKPRLGLFFDGGAQSTPLPTRTSALSSPEISSSSSMLLSKLEKDRAQFASSKEMEHRLRQELEESQNRLVLFQRHQYQQMGEKEHDREEGAMRIHYEALVRDKDAAFQALMRDKEAAFHATNRDKEAAYQKKLMDVETEYRERLLKQQHDLETHWQQRCFDAGDSP